MWRGRAHSTTEDARRRHDGRRRVGGAHAADEDDHLPVVSDLPTVSEGARTDGARTEGGPAGLMMIAPDDSLLILP